MKLILPAIILNAGDTAWLKPLRSISAFAISGLPGFSSIDGDFGFQGMKDLL